MTTAVALLVRYPSLGYHFAVTTIGRLMRLQKLSMVPAKLCLKTTKLDSARKEECRRQAAVSLLDKEAWLKMASEWTKLAQSTEKRTKK
jgi:hypothetical protein